MNLVGSEDEANDLIVEQTKKVDEALEPKKPEGDQ